MKKITLILCFFSFISAFSQVGIGTIDPKATIDIVASNQANPSSEDGILVPRIDSFPATNPIVDQDSMIVYLTTTDGTDTPGFYYWNNATTSWLPFGGSKDAWELLGNAGTNPATNFIGTTDNQDFVFKTNNIEYTRLTTKGQFELSSIRNNMFIGKQAGESFDPSFGFARRNIYIGEEAGFSNAVRADNIHIGYQSGQLNTLGTNSIAIGSFALQDATDTDYSLAIGSSSLNNRLNSIYNVGLGHRTLSFATTGNRNTAVGADAGRTTSGNNSIYVGYSADEENDGGENVVIGTRAGIQGFTAFEPTGRVLIGNNAWQDRDGNNLLVLENSSSVTPLIYGEFDNDIVRIGGQLQIGSSDDTTAGSVYAFPTTDGTNGQVLTTNGAGAVTWQDGGAATADADWFEVGTTTAPDAITDNIFTQGFVGIGDTTPDNILDIEAATGDAVVTISSDPGNTDEDANPRLVLSQDGGAIQGILELGSDGANDSNDFIFNTINSGSDLVFKTNNLERLRITTNGRYETSNSGNNIYFGTGAGGNDNFAFGHNNVAIGVDALSSNIVRSNNVAIGRRAMESSTGLDTSVAIGNNALANAIDGANSVAVGRNSLLTNLDSDRNTAIGSNALGGSATGKSNTALGYKAGTFAAEDGNVFVGSLADEQNVGGQNVIIGAEAGKVDAFGLNLDGRVFIGYNAGQNNPNENILAIENSSSVTPLIGGDFANDRVGINVNISSTANLTHTLTVGGDVRASGGFSTPTNTYPDYVFESYFLGQSKLNSDYNFMTLDNAIKFVKENGHLPNVKSYEEVKANNMDIDLGETSVKNLEKIEENFIYISELKSEIDTLKEENKLLREKLELIIKKLEE